MKEKKEIKGERGKGNSLGVSKTERKESNSEGGRV